MLYFQVFGIKLVELEKKQKCYILVNTLDTDVDHPHLVWWVPNRFQILINCTLPVFWDEQAPSGLLIEYGDINAGYQRVRFPINCHQKLLAEGFTLHVNL